MDAGARVRATSLTDEQRTFVSVAKGLDIPNTDFEYAWLKYVRLTNVVVGFEKAAFLSEVQKSEEPLTRSFCEKALVLLHAGLLNIVDVHTILDNKEKLDFTKHELEEFWKVKYAEVFKRKGTWSAESSFGLYSNTDGQ